jgi:iron complex transport system permease protein
MRAINREIEAAIANVTPRRKVIGGFVILSILLLIFFALDIFTGSLKIDPRETLRILAGDSDSQFAVIILKFRIPKALTAILAGIALSVSGLLMQTVFRNPMAGPYVLGISSGASLGVAFVILGFTSVIPSGAVTGLGNWLIIAAACAGAGFVMVIIMLLAIRVKDILTVLILGIMIAGGISAFVTILQYFTSETMLRAYVIWTMGSLGNLTPAQLKILTITILAGTAVSAVTVKMLNALLLGETYATSIGVNIKLARGLVFLATSILAGSVTAFCGPIGFVGIAVPHIARMMFRTSDHKILLPATIITGALIMLVSDIISQLPGSDKVLPVNAVTSLLGIPVVIWVILRGRAIKSNF